MRHFLLLKEVPKSWGWPPRHGVGMLSEASVSSLLLGMATEVRTEAESTQITYIFVILNKVSSVKTCGFIPSIPQMIYLSLSIRPSPRAWGGYFVNFQCPVFLDVRGGSPPIYKYPKW